MRSLNLAFLLVLSVILGVGCKKAPSLVGKWSGSVKGKPIAAEFKPDGTMTIDMNQGPVSALVTQSYTLEGDKLSTTIKDVEIKGVPPGREAQLDAYKRSQIGKSDVEKVQFTSGDQVALSSAKGENIALTRVKE